MKRLILASGNPGKFAEIRALLAPLGLEVLDQASLGVGEAEEPHDTFLENALVKARHASRVTGLPALADDSGLCVHALDGAPGVHSAYYAGAAGNRATRDPVNNAKLLKSLEGVADRRAHYVCVLVLVRHADDPQPIVVEGEWHGEIAPAERGAGGFGYDPLFLVPGKGVTSAELGVEEKNRLSHRGAALAQLVERLRALR